MDDLLTWLSQQHHGLRTFRIFQQKRRFKQGRARTAGFVSAAKQYRR